MKVDAWIPRALQRTQDEIPMRHARVMGIKELNGGLGIKVCLGRVVSLDKEDEWIWRAGEGEDRCGLGSKGKGALRWRP